jgi:hypothetical protein
VAGRATREKKALVNKTAKDKLAAIQQQWKCGVCMSECEDITSGYKCVNQAECKSFVCWKCLERCYNAAMQPDAIRGNHNDAGELLCPVVNCRCPVKLAALAKQTATLAVLPAVLEACPALNVQVVKQTA